ncbi:MAG: 23S rRNA (guanosine(2251)-2'-O)-methyltransferase RlmB [Spirochaetaceae bacterium]|jgi:23S rRNA (guanosine2251-2'-O)-methyltransferase|nr:23S rRNA (guanosine(2251)-2'-O)-methyltransferase RlmB [Spirochaetaceae bacterium]
MLWPLTGFHAIAECLQGGLTPSGAKLLYARVGPRVRAILEAARILGVPCEQAPPADLDALVASLPPAARDHRGLVLLMDTVGDGPPGSPAAVSLGGFLSHLAPEEGALVVVLDSITNPHNLGAILRSCDQFGVSLVIAPPRRSAVPQGDDALIRRSSAGAGAWVPFCAEENLSAAILRLKDKGFWVYGAHPSPPAIPVHRADFACRTVLVLGSEGSGISRLVARRCDTLVSIPTSGRIGSLNVSVACGILLYEIVRQRGCP